MKSSQMFSSSSDEPADERRGRKQKRGRGAADQDDRDFGAFLLQFPATASSSPPTKKKRTAAGFPLDRVFYDRWRAVQFAKREEHLLCKFMCFDYRNMYSFFYNKVTKFTFWTRMLI